MSVLCLSACTDSKPPVGETKTIVTPPMVGGDRDAHGCIGSAGYQWSVLKNECIRAFELKLKFKNLKVTSQGGWLLLSDDKKKGEFFGIAGATSVLFDFKNNRYESTDGKYQLEELPDHHWQLFSKGDAGEKLFETQ